MKRLLIYGLILVALATWLGTLIARAPGYVLLTWGEYTLQTSLWVLLLFLLIAFIAILIFLRFLARLAGAPAAYSSWRDARRLHKSQQQISLGLSLLFEGDYKKAEQHLKAAGGTNTHSAVGYLAAAWAAGMAGKMDDCEAYLGQAESGNPMLVNACQVTRLELAIFHGDLEKAGELLTNLQASNHHILLLRQQVHSGLGQHEAMLALVPLLAKHSKEEALQHEVAAALIGFEKVADDSARQQLFKSLSAGASRQADLLTGYVKALDDKLLAEPQMRSALRRQWHETLALAYGDLPDAGIDARRKQLNNWAAEHKNSPGLHYCLGRMHEADGNRDQAVHEYRQCLALGQLEAAGMRLAELHLASLPGKDDPDPINKFTDPESEQQPERADEILDEREPVVTGAVNVDYRGV